MPPGPRPCARCCCCCRLPDEPDARPPACAQRTAAASGAAAGWCVGRKEGRPHALGRPTKRWPKAAREYTSALRPAIAACRQSSQDAMHACMAVGNCQCVACTGGHPLHMRICLTHSRESTARPGPSAMAAGCTPGMARLQSLHTGGAHVPGGGGARVVGAGWRERGRRAGGWSAWGVGGRNRCCALEWAARACARGFQHYGGLTMM